MAPEIPYSYNPWYAGNYQIDPDVQPGEDEGNNFMRSVGGYIGSIPLEANGTVLRAFSGTRRFGDYLTELGRNMRTPESRRAAEEYDRMAFLDAIRTHPMELPHRVAQGMVIAGEAYGLGRLAQSGIQAMGATASMTALPIATSIGAQAMVNFGNSYNDLREKGYPFGRATARASGEAAISTVTDALGHVRFGSGTLAKRLLKEAGDETANEIGGHFYGDIPQSNYYRGQPVEQISFENVEPVSVFERDPNYVPAYVPRLDADYRVPVRRNSTPDPTYVPGGAYWRNADTGEAYYAERPVVRQNMQRDRWIPNEQEALDYPYGW